MDIQEKKGSNKVLIGLLVLQFVVIIVLAFLYFGEKKETEQGVVKIQQQDEEIGRKTQELEDLLAEYEQVKKEREAMGLSNDSLNVQMAQINKTLDELRRSNKINQGKMRELNAMIERLREDVDARDQEILDLRSRNDSLNSSVVALSGEKQQMGDTINTLKTVVATAQVLEAENVRVIARRDNGKPLSNDDGFKLRRVGQVGVEFNLGKNAVAKKGPREIYVAFVTSSGEVFSDPNSGGGEVEVDGTNVPYTMKQTVDFDNTQQKLSFLMYKDFDYKPGLHAFEIYAEGHKIGDASFVIKK